MTHHASFTPLWHTTVKIWCFGPFWNLFPLFTPCDVTNKMKTSEIFENHLVVLQCICHVNFTSPWPFVVKIPSLSDSERRPVLLRGVPVWRHSWNTKSLITFERFKQLTWIFFWNSCFPNGYDIKRQKTQLFSDDSSPLMMSYQWYWLR